MKRFEVAKHIVFVIMMMGLLVVLPVVTHFDIFQSASTDAVSSASTVLPDQPSGNYYVFMKTSLHENSLYDWKNFFNDEDFAVIFDDISCLIANGDEQGKQLAERYQAQLPENQMIIREENPTLLASKVENGYIDVAIFSKEMADVLSLKIQNEGLSLFEIKGGE